MGPSVDVCDCWLWIPWTACYGSDPTASKIQFGWRCEDWSVSKKPCSVPSGHVSKGCATRVDLALDKGLRHY